MDGGAERRSAKEQLRALALTKRMTESTDERGVHFLRNARKMQAAARLYSGGKNFRTVGIFRVQDLDFSVHVMSIAVGGVIGTGIPYF